jgi:GSH-dependent disulfide-bond oxidoreductase
MIDLYYWPTPNGHKITMFLEESGLDYRIHPVDISAGDQFKPDFLAISPNNRMPAIIDNAPADGGEPIGVFESGAILCYLADKIGRFLPKDVRGRKVATEWLFWQVGGLGPMAGQNHHFGIYAPSKIPYAIDRYVRETNRLYGVLDRHLENRTVIAGDGYSIADMGCDFRLGCRSRGGAYRAERHLRIDVGQQPGRDLWLCRDRARSTGHRLSPRGRAAYQGHRGDRQGPSADRSPACAAKISPHTDRSRWFHR